MRKIFIVIIIILFISPLSPSLLAAMESTNYIIKEDSINIGGRDDQQSSSYRLRETIGEVGTGILESSNYKIKAGYRQGVYIPKSQNWRWYDDETNETPTSPLADENVAPTNIANGNIIKLRFTIKETGGFQGTDIKMRIQYSQYSDFSQDVNFVTEVGNCTGNSGWCYGDGTDTDNDVVTSRVLGDSDANATHNESGTSATTYDHVANAAAEWEFTIKPDAPDYDTTYYFRVYDNTIGQAVPLNTNESYPSLVTEGAGLTFTVAGVSASIETEGVTTDVATSATAVNFGTLNIGTEIEGAQKLTVSTNATNGYQILVYGRQNLLSAGGEAIDSIAATNESPASWPIDPSPGGYGYHAGDDTLSGGSSARFSPNNTYAKFETTMKEIAYSSISVTDDVTDLIFKMEITNQQEAGDYSSEIVYIAVPTF